MPHKINVIALSPTKGPNIAPYMESSKAGQIYEVGIYIESSLISSNKGYILLNFIHIQRSINFLCYILVEYTLCCR